MIGRLDGKAIMVIGSATGIGAATVRRLAAERAIVRAADINLAGAEALAAEVLAQGGRAFAVPLDVTDEASVNHAVSSAVRRLGRMDSAHVNAADQRIIMRDSDALTEDLAVFDRTHQVKLWGHLLCTRAVLPHLLESGDGAIVYTSSGAADGAEPTRPACAASTSGLQALMRHVAARWGREGLTANCVAPGFTITPEMAAGGKVPADFTALMLSRTPNRRLGQVEDIAGVVALLLSSDGRWINGQVIHVIGGALMP